MESRDQKNTPSFRKVKVSKSNSKKGYFFFFYPLYYPITTRTTRIISSDNISI